MSFLAHRVIQHTRIRPRFDIRTIHGAFYTSTSFVRAMSTTAEPNKLFFVYAPDYTDPDAMNRRLKVRQQHLDNVRPLIESDRLSACRSGDDSSFYGTNRYQNLRHCIMTGVAGGLVTEQSLEPGAEKKFLGSTFIIKADNMEEVRKRMEADVYWDQNVVRDFVWMPPRLSSLTGMIAPCHLLSGTRRNYLSLLSYLLRPTLDIQCTPSIQHSLCKLSPVAVFVPANDAL